MRAFFDACAEPGNLIGALEQYLDEHVVWENTGLPTADGIAAAKGFMQHFIDNYDMHAMVVELTAIAASGTTVLTERIDHFDNAAGERVASIPVAGTLEVSGERIIAWRDYFDPRPFLG